jgi:transporter family protein
MAWWVFALISAVFAALTAIFGKLGVEHVPSTLATAVRTVVVLAFAWSIALARGEGPALSDFSGRTWWFLGISGACTGFSWIAYYRALQLAPASHVAPIDKLSLPLTVIFAFVFLSEDIGWKLGTGVALMVAGAMLTLAE